MPASHRSRAIARAAMLLAAAVAVTPAVAKSAGRAPKAAAFDAASLITIPKFSNLRASTTTAAAVPQAPARFFTINEALAKRDTGRPIRTAVRLATAATGEALEDVLEGAVAVKQTADEPFGMHAFRAPEGMLWKKWRGLQAESADEEPRLKSCRHEPSACADGAARFWAMVDEVRGIDGRARLERINQLANAAIAYASDLSMHGELDRWSTPLATLQRGRGDCEDYAILKYKLLIEAGVAASDLRIVLVRDTAVRVDHAVLSARVGKHWYTLDNRRGGFYADGELPHYMPLFALDQGGVKLFAAPYASLGGMGTDDMIQPGLNDDPDTAGGGIGLPLVF